MTIPLLTTMRYQDAVYWPPVKDELGRLIPTPDGKTRFGPLVELRGEGGNGVLWFDAVEAFTDRTNRQRMSQAKVFVGEEVGDGEGGVLFLGKVSDIPQGMVDAPLSIPKAAQIQKLFKTPTFTPGEYVRVAVL
jgi:hypothetical protein